MAMDLTYNHQDRNDDRPNLIDHYHSLSEQQYLRTYIPLTRQNNYHVALGLRRSVSLEDASKDKNSQDCPNLSKPNSSLSSSVTSLCVRLHAHQLLPEFNKFMEQSANEHQFDWWNTIEHLRPLLEHMILNQRFDNEFHDDSDKHDKVSFDFRKSKRNGRRNAVCLAVDRLCFNQQLLLFVTMSNQIQIEYNLISSGFTL